MKFLLPIGVLIAWNLIPAASGTAELSVATFCEELQTTVGHPIEEHLHYYEKFYEKQWEDEETGMAVITNLNATATSLDELRTKIADHYSKSDAEQLHDCIETLYQKPLAKFLDVLTQHASYIAGPDLLLAMDALNSTELRFYNELDAVAPRAAKGLQEDEFDTQMEQFYYQVWCDINNDLC